MNEANAMAVTAATQNEIPTLAHSVSEYLAVYKGADGNRPTHLDAWVRLFGLRQLATISIDDIEDGLRHIAAEPSRYYAGKDADGNRIFKKRGNGKRSNATVNRYFVAICALFTWSRKNRWSATAHPAAFDCPPRLAELC